MSVFPTDKWISEAHRDIWMKFFELKRQNIMKVEIYKSGLLRKSWKWRLKARNGRIMAHGTGFNRIYECEESVGKVIEALSNKDIEIVIL